MKLTSVFLLFFFSCVVFYVGTVSTFSALENHHSDHDGPYTAIAFAARQGGHLPPFFYERFCVGCLVEEKQ